jgi:hypothetical protein
LDYLQQPFINNVGTISNYIPTGRREVFDPNPSFALEILDGKGDSSSEI